jgi:hypothetical protein
VKVQRSTILTLGAALSSGAVATGQTPLTGPTIADATVGDYLVPRFSPSGQLLAVSQVLADTAGESTQILVLNIGRRVLDTLLPTEAAAKYATYKAYVSDFKWLSDTSLVAWIPDGDVGVTGVTFNVPARRILHEEHHEGEEDSLPPYQPLADSLARLYPDVAPSGVSPSEVFGSGLNWPTVHGRGFVLVQKRYAGVDDDIWLYRLDRRDAKRILPLSGGARASLAGGFTTSRDIIFAVGSDTLGLYRLRRGRVESLMRVPVRPQGSTLAVRAQRGDSVWFILRLHASYERGSNPAFLYDGKRLLPLADYAELADCDVHLPTRRIAFVYWDGRQRHLAVKQLLTGGQQPRVPALPPDSVPNALWDKLHTPENMIRSSPEWSAPFSRDLIVLAFKEDATQAERQQAVDAVGGEVIGGEHVDRGGYYYVRIRSDGTADALFRAITKLKTFPKVDIASPEPPSISPN